ncbi:MAG: hypothetical protein WB662_18580, partial [Methyloceanibacter sp.]
RIHGLQFRRRPALTLRNSNSNGDDIRQPSVRAESFATTVASLCRWMPICWWELLPHRRSRGTPSRRGWRMIRAS